LQRYVIASEGQLLGRVPIPENLITNVAFGGPDLKTLYAVYPPSVRVTDRTQCAAMRS
jgi:sugar lactone lactonase YvrE